MRLTGVQRMRSGFLATALGNDVFPTSAAQTVYRTCDPPKTRCTAHRLTVFRGGLGPVKYSPGPNTLSDHSKHNPLDTSLLDASLHARTAPAGLADEQMADRWRLWHWGQALSRRFGDHSPPTARRRVHRHGSARPKFEYKVMLVEQAAHVAPVEMTVDRPFVFFIREVETGTILFLGRVLDPSV